MAKPEQVIPEKVIGYELGSTSTQYKATDAILYAATIGASADPMNVEDLDFTYELSENFKVMPTFGVVLANFMEFFDALQACPGLPEYNPMMLLHGEQDTEVFKPFPPEGKINMKSVISDVADKTKGALLTISTEKTLEETGEVIGVDKTRIFIRGIGGFGFKGQTKVEPLPATPDRAPDRTVSEQTAPNQAILYRLNSDLNPLHISPDMAAMGGFEKPILHGLCTFGFSTRAVLKEYCNNDVSAFKSISTRFTSHVFPGETLITEMWQEGDKVIFTTKTAERGKVVIQGQANVGTPAPKL